MSNFQPFPETDYIFGLHEPGGEGLMLSLNRPGWVVFTEEIGHDPNDATGVDFTPWAEAGLGVICRIAHGPTPEGTIPHSSLYAAFAQRVANFTATSRGCHIWVIGDEMNYAASRPDIRIDWSRHAESNPNADRLDEADPLHRGLNVRFDALPDNSNQIRTTRGAIVSPGEVITPDLYTRCFRLCREAIRRVPGREGDQVLVGAVCPWNTQTKYYGNPNGDWVQYFGDILRALGPSGCDGFALHAFTHGGDPTLITSDARLANPPFQNHHREFRVYRDFLAAVPETMRRLPAYITQADQTVPWANVNSGWVQRAYGEINHWNVDEESTQKIRALCLYRWPPLDKWYIEGKQSVVEDFLGALRHDYRWRKAVTQSSVEQSSVEQSSVEQSSVEQSSVEQSSVNRLSVGEGEDADGSADLAPVEGRAASAAEIRAERRAEAEEAARTPYRVEWVEHRLPDRTVAGETIEATVTLRNGGTLPWMQSASHPFRLGYRYYRNRQLLPLRPQQDLRTMLEASVAPGESTSAEMRIALPSEPGNYTLEIDLIHEGVTRFKEQNSPVLSRWITVESTARIQREAVIEEASTRAEEAPTRDGVPSDQLTPASNKITQSEAPPTTGQNGNGTLPVPLFKNVATTLPRSDAAYARRNLGDVRYLVISHTAAHPQTRLASIARTHVKQGYPGIAYNFVVDASGQVFKTSELEEIVRPEEPWSRQGVNICLAGNFAESAPALVQIDATARLCSWLAQNLDLGLDAIRGLGELTGTRSPGVTFYRGAQWKDLLRNQVKLRLAALENAADSGSVQRLSAQVKELTAQVETARAELEKSLAERESLRMANERLTGEVDELMRQIEVLPEAEENGQWSTVNSQLSIDVDESGGATNSLRVRNMVETLPRDGERYVERRREDVRYLVVNHTGASAELPLAEIAEAHRPEWPGILYDFCVATNGVIYQTQPLDEVVETSQPYLAQAINVALMGNFGDPATPTPTDRQLYAAGRLAAWLMERFPQISPDGGMQNVRGLREFIEHDSPGAQWTEGRAWKAMLLASIRRARGLIDPSEIEQELRHDLGQSEQRGETLLGENERLQGQLRALNVERQRLQMALDRAGSQGGQTVIPQPAVEWTADALPRHPTLRYESRALSAISHIAIHHSATPPSMSPYRIAEMQISPDGARGKEAWPGIGYHYFVHADGRIEQTNALETVSFHVHKHNAYSAGVVFAGSFMNGRVPTSAQLRSGAQLVAWLMQRLNVPLARVWGHKEFPDNDTICPGSEWRSGNEWREQLFERVQAMQKGVGVKTLRHYLLTSAALLPALLADDAVGAREYVSRFQPSLGLAPGDARNAEYVTIAGDESAVGAAVEKTLRNQGCKVERVAGGDGLAVSRRLGELVERGKRFEGFGVDF